MRTKINFSTPRWFTNCCGEEFGTVEFPSAGCKSNACNAPAYRIIPHQFLPVQRVRTHREPPSYRLPPAEGCSDFMHFVQVRAHQGKLLSIVTTNLSHSHLASYSVVSLTSNPRATNLSKILERTHNSPRKLFRSLARPIHHREGLNKTGPRIHLVVHHQ